MDVSDALDVREQPGLAARLIRVVFYALLGCLVAQRAWAYRSPIQEPSYPMPAMVMSACLIAVLYTLSILTLVGRSGLLSSSSSSSSSSLSAAFDGRDDSSRPRADGRAKA